MVRPTFVASLIGPVIFLLGLAAISPTVAAARDRAGSSAAPNGLQAAAADPTEGGLASEVLKTGRGLTSFQRHLLRVDVLLEEPRFKAGLKSLAAGRALSEQQLMVVLTVLHKVRNNPAVAAIKRRGLYLRAHPAQVRQAVIEALTSPLVAKPPPTAPGLTSKKQTKAPGQVYARLSKAASKPAARRETRRVVTILKGPHALAYLRSLPPLALATLVPEGEPSAAGAARASSAGAATCAVASVPSPDSPILDEDETTALDEARADLAKLGDTVSNLLEKIPVPANPVAAAALRRTLAALGITSSVIAAPEAGVVTTYALTTAGALLLFKELWDLATSVDPSYLDLTPAASTVEAGVGQAYRACGVDEFGTEVALAGTISLTISGQTPGFSGCDSGQCESIELGSHAITATFGSAKGYATLTVEPGELASLRPEPSAATVASGTWQKFSVQGLDRWQHPLGLLGPSSKLGQAALSIEPSGGTTGAKCQADECSAEEPGSYTVTASLPSSDIGTDSATLVVEPKGKLAITPESFGSTQPDLNFTQQFEAPEASGPVTWELEILDNVENCADCAFYGFTPEYFEIEPSGLLRGRGLQPGESLTARIRAHDAEWDEGEVRIALVGAAPPPCATVCLYPGTEEIHHPVPTTFGALFNSALDGGAGVAPFRYIYDGVVLDPWPTYYPEGTNSFEVRSVAPGQEWWVPWMYAWVVRSPDLEPGHRLALEAVEDYSVEGHEEEKVLATSNTIVLK